MFRNLKKIIHNWTLTDPEAIEFLGEQPTKSGVVVTDRAAMQQATVFACIRILSNNFASLPLNIYEKSKDGTRNIAHDFHVQKVLHSPNEFMTPTEFKGASMISLLFTGERYAEIIRDKRKNIVALVPIQADLVNMDKEALKRGKLIFKVQQESGTERTILGDNMWRSIGLTVDGINGLSPIKFQRETIGHAIRAGEHGATMLAKGGAPSVVIKANVIDPVERNSMRKEWDSRYENGGGSAIIPSTWEIEPLKVSNEDMQYLQSRKFQRAEIASIFGVPLHFVGDMEKATLNNVEQQSLEFITFSLRPYLTAYEESISRDLLTKDERKKYYAKFNIKALLRGDTKSQAEFYDKMTKNGVFSINEIRELEEMNPIDGGDGHWRQLNEQEINKEVENERQKQE